MKSLWKILPLVFVALLVASCDKLKGGSGAGYEMEAFGFQSEEDGKWGIMDMDGNVIVKPKFEGSITAVINGSFSVYDEEESEYTLYSLVDNKPKKIGKYRDVGGFTGNLCPAFDEDCNAKYIDKEGKTVLDLKKINGKRVVAAFNFFCGRAMVKLENEKWGYINEKGETVIPFKYADAWNFSDDVAIVFLQLPDEPNAKWMVIDKDGNELFTKKFKDMSPNDYKFSGGYLVVNDKNDNHCIIDKKGEVVKKLKEELNITNVPINGLFTIFNIDEEQHGLMDLEGNWVLKDKYESVVYNGKLLAASTDEEKFSLFSTKGEKLGRLPRGGVILFDPEFKNSGNRMLVGSYEDGYKLLDGEGKKIDTAEDIYQYSLFYYWGASCEGEEEYYEDYDEEDDDPDAEVYDEDEDIEDYED